MYAMMPLSEKAIPALPCSGFIARSSSTGTAVPVTSNRDISNGTAINVCERTNTRCPVGR